ncbi:hypothetical protein STEG23_014527 [Scotinomys teguina]
MRNQTHPSYKDIYGYPECQIMKLILLENRISMKPALKDVSEVDNEKLDQRQNSTWKSALIRLESSF